MLQKYHIRLVIDAYTDVLNLLTNSVGGAGPPFLLLASNALTHLALTRQNIC